MSCQACSSGTNPDGSPRGCGSKGSCGTGSCNRLSTFDWLSHLGLDDSVPTHFVEVSFKEGMSKGFYKLRPGSQVFTGDNVAVETKSGYDVGRVTLSGELVRLQMKKKRVQEKHVHHDVLRVANFRDLERMFDARSREKETLVKSRAIVRTLGLDMKVSDVEWQGDGRKVTVYYTATKRVDFRELIRQFAHAFKTKIEMKQIGARQESARLGGIGSCGRELCCSTWLSDFKSVNTAAARYQNIAINQTKLSGQCGRLKCCLNYELDTYLEALEAFPKRADKLKTDQGLAILIKTDIFKQIMYYTYKENRGALYAIPVKKVHEVIALNKAGETVSDLKSLEVVVKSVEKEHVYEDVTGVVELKPLEKRRRGRKRGKTGRGKSSSTRNKEKNSATAKEGGDATKKRSNRRRKPKSKNGSGQPKAESGQQPAAKGDAPKKNKSRNRSRNRRKKKPE
ncbi:hypothetical protein CEQ90_11240 [Lewinellaceae bacterium SD302]|nr:hypothetical protein CEQ90_11240 [Lewinellaceae bacterium SD302]